jgi:hypothetical protein
VQLFLSNPVQPSERHLAVAVIPSRDRLPGQPAATSGQERRQNPRETPDVVPDVPRSRGPITRSAAERPVHPSRAAYNGQYPGADRVVPK